MELTLTSTQAFQLAALGPCLFLILYLVLSAQQLRLVIVPALYFLSLTCSFLLPILGALPVSTEHLRAVLLFNEHLLPAISFLFILQLILRRPPPLLYWTIFALPLVGGGSLLYLSFTQEEACLADEACVPAEQVMMLYRVISSAVVFMLLVVLMRRMPAIRRNDTIRKQKYWLITMLIIYNLILMALELAYIAGQLDKGRLADVKTVLGISFLYLVTTSVFRVFNGTLGLKPGAISRNKDEKLARAIKELLLTEKPYRQLGYNRGKMADYFRITEQHLSRVINQHFKESFSDLMNRYRIEEAKHLLEHTNLPVTTIAFDCGYSSITSFNRVFKQATGEAPSLWRKNRALSSRS